MSLPHATQAGSDEDGVFTRAWFRFFASVWRRIGGGSSYSLGGILSYDVDEVGNVGTGEDDLITYTLPENTIELDGSTIEVIAFGTTANNTNTKEIKLYFGGTEIFSVSGQLQNKSWKLHCHVIKTGDSSQKCATMFVASGGDSECSYSETTKDFSGDLVIKCTGEATSNDDIVQEGLIVNLNPR